MFLASAILSVQTQAQTGPKIFYYSGAKNIDVAGNIQLEYGAAKMNGGEGSIDNLCYSSNNWSIVNKESNILVDADNSVYFLRLISPYTWGVGGTCSAMDAVNDFDSSLLNLDGPMNLQATY